MTAVLRCERVSEGDVDRVIAAISPATLARTPEGAFLEIEPEGLERAVRLLAFAGVRAVESTQQLGVKPGLRPALGRDLTPLPLRAIALDLVHVRAMPLGAEVQRLMPSLPWRRLSSARRAVVRDLLHDRDVAIGWRRRAWTTRDVLRTAEARRALRAVVFDVVAIASPPEHRGLAREGALGRWLFA